MHGEQPDTTSTQVEANVYSEVYRLLIFGMVVSNVLYAAGILLAFLHPRYIPVSPEWIRSQYQFQKVVQGVISGDPLSLMLLATALLILTPVARVVVSIAAFWADRDYKYVIVTSTVLLVMGVTVILGLLGLQ